MIIRFSEKNDYSADLDLSRFVLPGLKNGIEADKKKQQKNSSGPKFNTFLEGKDKRKKELRNK